jgi:transposase-like protein
MSKKVQRQYSPELKSIAVKMVLEELKTLNQVSQDLHIPLQTLHNWVNNATTITPFSNSHLHVKSL